MNTFTLHTDVQRAANFLKTLVGARLQEVMLSGRVLAFGFFHDQEIVWLTMDLSPLRPGLVLLSGDTLAGLRLKPEKKPLVLFLKSHFVDHRLVAVDAEPRLGRVLRLNFGGDATIELRLFPHGQNVLAARGDKSIALFKPAELKEVDEILPMTVETQDLVADGIQWAATQARRPTTNSPIATSHDVEREKQIAKLNKALVKIGDEIANKRSKQWQAAGMWLKTHGHLKVPLEFAEYVDAEKSLSWNIENCFKEHKSGEKKIEGTLLRERQLREQLDKLAAGQAVVSARPQKAALPKVEGVKGRKTELAEGIELFIGRSAEDNLRILRQARPWYLWLHLRDFPGTHGIVAVNKGVLIPDPLLHKAAEALLEKQFGEKSGNYQGEKFDFIVAECRFVKPIKGDRIGRVTYTNARTLTHRFSLD